MEVGFAVDFKSSEAVNAFLTYCGCISQAQKMYFGCLNSKFHCEQIGSDKMKTRTNENGRVELLV